MLIHKVEKIEKHFGGGKSKVPLDYVKFKMTFRLLVEMLNRQLDKN